MDDALKDIPGTSPVMPISPTAQPPLKSKGCLFGFFGGCFVTLLLMVAAPVIVFIIGMIALWNTAEPAISEYVQTPYTYCSGEGEVDVLRLELNGPIGMSTSSWMVEPDSDIAVLEAIEEVIEDEEIRAILLVLDSPGGGITASDNLYHAFERFKAAYEGRKVIVLGRDLVASGGYYVALQADWIRLQPTSLVGSIGVIVPGINVAQLAQRLGIADYSIASGDAKDLGNPLKPVNPAHTALLQEVVNTLHARFVSLVAKHRKLGMDEVRKVADGRVFTAEDAVNRKLADDVGYEDTLEIKIAELLGCAPVDLCFVAPRNASLPHWQRFLMCFPETFGQSFFAPMTERTSAVPQYRY